MALHHVLLRPFFALLVSALVSVLASVGLVWAGRAVAALLIDSAVYMALLLGRWLRRLWHLLLIVALSFFLTSVIFWQIIQHDDSLDIGLDAALDLVARTVAQWPTRIWCRAFVPAFFPDVCRWLPAGNVTCV